MRSNWWIPVSFGAALLVAVVLLGFVLSGRASRVLNEELDRHLITMTRQTARALKERMLRKEDLVPLLVDLRDSGEVEHAFVISPEGLSVADARSSLRPGQRYSLLDYDPEALSSALRHGAVLGPAWRLESVPLKSAYAAIDSDAVLIVDASPSFAEPVQQLRRLPWIASVLGLLAAVVFTLALRAAQRRLRESVQGSLHVERLAVAGRLAAQVAHEIRNPLAILRGAVQLAQGAAEAGREVGPHLKDLIEEVDRINDLVSDFLALSRDVPLNPADCDMNAVADRAAALAEVAGKRRIHRALLFPAPRLTADERRLRQAVLALLLNALEASPSSEVTVRTGDEWIEVADNGPGMSAEVLARVGEPFFTTKATGTGLGVAVARQIAEAHGGSLQFMSRPGTGTQARLVIPRQAA